MCNFAALTLNRRVMAFERVISNRVVLSKDLNPHGTFLACRGAEWFIESAYSAVASVVSGKNLVCLKIHSIDFFKPVYNGDILIFESMIVDTGKCIFDVYVSAYEKDEPSDPCLCGFVTYCNVDDETQPVPHGVTVVAESAVEKGLQSKMNEIKKRSL